MARTDKDAAHKEVALRFCVATNTVPYLEVLVSSAIELSDTERLLTDIDVLGVHLSDDGQTHRAIYDCKSSKTPPMGRAFWLAGLMSFVHAEEGFVILGRRAERAHRLAAQTMDVRLFDKESFHLYAGATSPSFSILSSYAASTESWYRLHEAGQAQGQKFIQLTRFLFSEIPLAQNKARAFRKLLAVGREHRGELDPAKPYHMAMFAEMVCATTLLLVPMVGELRNLIELNDNLENFSSLLRLYIWGGRDGIQILQKINEARPDKPDLQSYETHSLAWPQLIQLIRAILEAPTSLASCGLPARELTLRYMGTVNSKADEALGQRLSQKRVRQFINRIALYVAAASRLPSDFPKQYSVDLDRLVDQFAAKSGSGQASPRTLLVT